MVSSLRAIPAQCGHHAVKAPTLPFRAFEKVGLLQFFGADAVS
jgi:hypothetical protein